MMQRHNNTLQQEKGMCVGNELVVCKTHSVQRMAKYCAPSPVYNADRDVVGYTYACTAASTCSTSARGIAAPLVGGVAAETPPDASDPRISDDARAQLETSSFRAQQQQGAAAASAPRGPSRYYDIGGSNRTLTVDQRPKKVCWSCGMDNHEKPQCNNQLCKRCHGLINNGQQQANNNNNFYGAATSSYYNNSNANHICTEIPPSPFVLLTPLTEEDLAFTRCVSCHLYGHMDCGSRGIAAARKKGEHAPKTISCCHCGESGHHGFDCHQQQYPDRWVQCVMAVGKRLGMVAEQRPQNSSNHAGVSSNRPPQRRPRDDDDNDDDGTQWSFQRQQQQQHSQRNLPHYGGVVNNGNSRPSQLDNYASNNQRILPLPQVQQQNNNRNNWRDNGVSHIVPVTRYQQQQPQYQQQYTTRGQLPHVAPNNYNDSRAAPSASPAYQAPQKYVDLTTARGVAHGDGGRDIAGQSRRGYPQSSQQSYANDYTESNRYNNNSNRHYQQQQNSRQAHQQQQQYSSSPVPAHNNNNSNTRRVGHYQEPHHAAAGRPHNKRAGGGRRRYADSDDDDDGGMQF